MMSDVSIREAAYREGLVKLKGFKSIAETVPKDKLDYLADMPFELGSKYLGKETDETEE